VELFLFGLLGQTKKRERIARPEAPTTNAYCCSVVSGAEGHAQNILYFYVDCPLRGFIQIDF
jgi:hypothetical protein